MVKCTLLLLLLTNLVNGSSHQDTVSTSADTNSVTFVDSIRVDEKMSNNPFLHSYKDHEITVDSLVINFGSEGRPWYETILSVLTIFVLAVTAVSSYLNIRDTRRFRKNEAKHRYYTNIILDPVTSETKSFINSARRILQNVGLKDKDTLFEVLYAEYEKYYSEINMSFEGWDDRDLRTDIIDIVLGVEEKIINSIYKKQLKEPRSILVQLIESEGEIYKRLMESDPIVE